MKHEFIEQPISTCQNCEAYKKCAANKTPEDEILECPEYVWNGETE